VLDRPGRSTLLVRKGVETREVTYERLILATGARERFLPFPGWTLPNVTGAGGLQLLAKAGLPVEGRSVVVAGSGPLLLASAAYLRERGAVIHLVAEQASVPRLARLALGLVGDLPRLRQAGELSRQLRGIPYRSGCWPIRAEGDGKVERVVLRQGRREWVENCDYLACGFHLVPNTELADLLGCLKRNGLVVVDEWQETSVPGVYAAGELVGIGGHELALLEGEIAGLAATGQRDAARNRFGARRRLVRFRRTLERTFALNPGLRDVVTDETIVCRCEDVRAGQLGRYDAGRQARLQTRCGMGRCQGRVCGPAAEFLWGWDPRGVRPPLVPATVDQLIQNSESGPSEA
jgi:NADPH-dependent 2,4-dienoyl-CoA reductase/sulfur reductase-like enzyme